MANATAEKPVKKVKLFDKRVDFSKLGDKTMVQFFGKVCTIGQVAKKLWAAYRKDDLLLD